MIKSNVTIRQTPGLIKLLGDVADSDIKLFGDIAIEAARDETPVLTGHLKRSLIAVSEGPRSVVLKSRTGSENAAPYGAYVHFGTSRMAANPFMARGVDRAVPEFKRIIAARGTYRD